MKDAAFLLHSIQMTGSLFIIALAIGAVTAFFLKDAFMWLIKGRALKVAPVEPLEPVKFEHEESDLVKIAKKIADRKRALQ